MRTYKRIVLAALAAAAIAAGAVAQESSLAGSRGDMSPYGRESALTGDPSQWGVAKKGSFDITEELIASGDEDNNGDVPVVPGLAGSRGDAAFGRESSIAGSAGDNAKIARESA